MFGQTVFILNVSLKGLGGGEILRQASKKPFQDFASSLTVIDDAVLSALITFVLLSAMTENVAHNKRVAKLINLLNIFGVSPLERFRVTIGSMSVPDEGSRWSRKL
jgi:hypothetical protein